MLEEKDPVRQMSVGESQYHKKRIQPWDIWEEYNLNPWDADIIKRVLRNKPGQKILDYEKIKHLCDERIRQLRCESALETKGEEGEVPDPQSQAAYLAKMRAEVQEKYRTGQTPATTHKPKP